MFMDVERDHHSEEVELGHFVLRSSGAESTFFEIKWGAHLLLSDDAV